jgi:octaprenyl-diphosphate synthase
MDMNAVLQLMDDDLKRVELQFQENLRSDVDLIPTVGSYVLRSGGKRIRPLLLLLAARLCGYRGERAVPLASIVEFIHTATLLHDDVVDNADLRRGQESANAVWGNEASVLVGDFLFSKSFSLLVRDGDIRILQAMSDATTRMAEGEVLELLKTADLETLEAEYLQVVINKTAVLLAAACEIGALLGGADDDRVAALRSFGMEVGVAFQLMDDCLDYVGDQKEFGKEPGTDLHEGKITLPLIHALRLCTEQERAVVQTILEKDGLEPLDLQRVTELIEKYDGIAFTRDQASERIDRAKTRLDLFETCPERAALATVADYVVSRTR